MGRALAIRVLSCVALSMTACAGPPRSGPDGSVDAGGGLDAAPVDGAPLDAADAPDAGPPLRVLFVGNSYTSSNDLPGVVESILDETTAAGATTESVLMGGARLADHWMTTGGRERVESGEHDLVVLQGQSLEALSPAYFQEHAELFSVAMADAGARGVWFATWGRRDVEGEPGTLWSLIEGEYAIAAARNDDALARVGAAFEIAMLEMPEVPVLSADLSHPTAEGTLLASCVIAQAISGRPPRLPDPTPLGLDRELARRLCAIADAGVPCGPQQSLCAGECVPWGPASCGACDVTCDEGDPCRRGVCGCDAGFAGCDGTCVRLGTVDDCGGCGDVCGLGNHCTAGACGCFSAGLIGVAADYRLTTEELYARFAALEPGCDLPESEASEACMTAAHRFCVETGCFSSGFGPPVGHAPMTRAVMCLPGVVRETSFTALATHEPGCDGVAARTGQPCVTAVHRFCADEGFASGFGPLDTSGDAATVTCLSDATVVRIAMDELSTHASRCVPDAGTCSAAAWNLCASRGHAAGFGPVEIVGDERDVVCVD